MKNDYLDGKDGTLEDLDSTYLRIFVKNCLIQGIFGLKEISRLLYKNVGNEYEEFVKDVPLFLSTQALMLGMEHQIDVNHLNELSIKIIKYGVQNYLGNEMFKPSFLDKLWSDKKSLKSKNIRSDGIFLYHGNKRTTDGRNVSFTFVLVFNKHGLVYKIFKEGYWSPSSKDIREIAKEFSKIKEKNDSDVYEYELAYNLFSINPVSAYGMEYFIGSVEDNYLVVTLFSNLMEFSSGVWISDKILNQCRFRFIPPL